MDIHPSKEMVASAQKAGRTRKTQAHIRIWSPETLYTLYIVGNGEFEEGVSALAFSQLVRCAFFFVFLNLIIIIKVENYNVYSYMTNNYYN